MTTYSNAESLRLQDTDTDLWSTKATSTLLNVPLEIRLSIYDYLFSIETNTDLPASSDTTNFSLTSLHICRQVRSEALDCLLNKYSWTRVTNLHDQIRVSHEITQLPHLPINLFTAAERERAMARGVLNVQIVDSTPCIAGSSRDDILVCYTSASQVVISEILVAKGARNPLAIITVPQKSTSRRQSEIQDLLLPLARVRGRTGLCRIAVEGMANRKLEIAFEHAMSDGNTSFDDYNEHALALLEESNVSFGRGHYKAAAADYLDGLNVCGEFLYNYRLGQIQSSADQLNTIESLRITLANGFSMASEITVILSYEQAGGLLPETIHRISTMFDMRDASFAWHGMSDRQRIEAHYHYGIALQYLGEYLQIPGHRDYMLSNIEAELAALMDRTPEDHFEAAAAQFFYAWQVDVDSSVATMLESRYIDMSYKTGFFMLEDPQLITVDGVEWCEDETWTGDPALVAEWTLDEMQSADSLLEMNHYQRTSEKELMRTKKELRMPGDQCNGLIRLLGLGNKASAKAICSSWW